MIFNSFITQVGMIILAVGIAIFYVQPTFTKIGELQEAVSQYQTEREKVTSVNNTLSDLVTKINSITAADMNALLTYMPDKIDHVAVARDIFAITKASGTYLESVEYSGIIPAVTASTNTDYNPPVRHSFSANVSGSYEQIKLFLTLLEQNNYPLEIHEFKISTTETGLITADVTVVTYSHI